MPGRSRRSGFVLYAAGFCALAAVYAVVLATAGATVSQAIRNALAVAIPNAVAGFLGVRLAASNPWRGRRLGRFLAVHASAVAGLVVLATASWAVLGALDSWLFGTGFAFRATRIVVSFQFLTSALVQLAVVAITHAWHGARRLAEAEALRARAELASLRSQLNPHFVLNILHALLGLVRREPAAAEAALEQLGGLLRYGLRVHQGGIDAVALREEWQFAVHYLDLEKLRLGDRLQVALAAADEVMAIAVPPFCLQPLVENAVLHAVAPRRTGGTVRVSAARSGGTLRLSVEDDGPGASAAQVMASSRAGLRLLRERLLALHGGAARLLFEDAAPGLRVVLELPADDAVAPS